LVSSAPPSGPQPEARVKSLTDSVQAEAKSIAPLVERGLIARPRILQLERTTFGLEGQIADTNANVAKNRSSRSPTAPQ
jgi:hypothetical protein